MNAALLDRTQALCAPGLSLEESFEGIAALLGEFFDAPIVILMTKHEAGARVEAYYRFGALRMPDNPLLGPDSISALVLRTKTSQLFVSDEDWMRRSTFLFAGEGPPTRSAVFVPLLENSETVGLVSMQSFSSAAYGTDDVSILESLAPHLAALVARALRRTF